MSKEETKKAETKHEEPKHAVAEGSHSKDRISTGPNLKDIKDVPCSLCGRPHGEHSEGDGLCPVNAPGQSPLYKAGTAFKA